ncbi:MAG: hypothetical protein SGPRY_012838, partial [Prymnesium sp.]
SYEERRTDFKKALDERTGISASERAPGMQGFNSSTQRFKPLTKRVEPGPGAYETMEQQSFITHLQRRTHGRHGVFGSTTRRRAVPHTLPRSILSNETRCRGSSSFASSMTRFAKTAPSSTTIKGKKQQTEAIPAPWKYKIKSQNLWDHQYNEHKGDFTFGSKVERFPSKPGVTKGLVIPGPGAYHPNDEPRKQHAHSEGFGSKESRFSLGRRGIFESAGATPGPGEYDSSVEMHNPLVKRSFNITIG